MSLDRAELQDSARRMFGEGGLAPERSANWSLIAEMGWLGLAAPEELGGLGQGRDALATLYLELGRVLAPAPVAPALLAIDAVAAAEGLGDREAWIERLVGGEIVTASLQGSALAVSGGKASGTVAAVPDADEATHLLAWSEDRAFVGLLPLQQGGAEVVQRETWDKSRRLFDVTVNGLEAVPLATGEAAANLADRLEAHLLLALAADSVGAASAALEMTVDYLQTRKQFSRPLAMFQALKHRCADLRAIIAAAEALLWKTAEDAQTDPLKAAGLKTYACQVFHAVAEETIQLHGGIGLTEEHPSHLFLKRALLNDALGGGQDAWDQAIGADALQRLGNAA